MMLQRAAEVVPMRSRTIVGLGLALTALFVGTVLSFMQTTTFDIWGAFFIALLLIAFSLPIFVREAARTGDRRLVWFLLLALALKLAGGVVRHYVTFEVYEGTADVSGYHGRGTALSANFWQGNFETDLVGLTGTNFIKVVTGVLYTITGPTLLGGFLVFAWLAFWGVFFFWKAITIAVPEARTKTYRWLVFLMPSLLFWPSSVGKDAWMVFTLGIAAYGAAHAVSGRTWRGVALASLGLWAAAMVRPHVAGMMAVAFAAGYLVTRPRKELRQLAPLAKILGLGAVTLLAGFFLIRTDRFLHDSNLGSTASGTAVLDTTSERTNIGGSAFDPLVLRSPAQAPGAAITVLFRPLLHEVGGAQQIMAGLEGTLLLGFTLLRWRWIVEALRSVRRRPYVALALVFTGLFVIAFSGFGNFGLLMRERVQVLPLYLALLCIPPRTRRPSPPALSPIPAR
jgi:hypothetical protein